VSGTRAGSRRPKPRSPPVTVRNCRQPGPAAARELLAELIEAGARHCVLACIGLPSAQWAADEIVNPVRALARA
jgi:hypothetical protein